MPLIWHEQHLTDDGLLNVPEDLFSPIPNNSTTLVHKGTQTPSERLICPTAIPPDSPHTHARSARPYMCSQRARGCRESCGQTFLVASYLYRQQKDQELNLNMPDPSLPHIIRQGESHESPIQGRVPPKLAGLADLLPNVYGVHMV